MNIGGMVIAVVLGVFVLVGVRQSILLWVGSSRFPYRTTMPPGMPMSPYLWKHYVRAIPVLALAMVFLAGAMLIAALANGLATVIRALCSALLVFGAAPVIVLFNRPKVLVPPPCRGQAGWIKERQRK